MQPTPPESNSGSLAASVTRRVERNNDRNYHNPTGSWHRSTATLVADAHGEVTQSADLRGSGPRVCSVSTKSVEIQQSVVSDTLRRRVKETRNMSRKLRCAETQLEEARSGLLSAGATASRLATQLEAPLARVKQQAQLRSLRPGSENIDDTASRAIEAQRAGTKAALGTLRDLMERADRLSEDMRRQIVATQQDAELKEAAAAVDTRCLQYGDGRGASAEDSRVAVDAVWAAVSHSPTHPTTWKQSSLHHVDACRVLQRSADDLRTKILVECQRLSDEQQRLNQATNESLQRKLHQTQYQLRVIERETRGVESEMAVLQQDRQRTVATLEATAGPLDVLKKRMEGRQRRPNRELVRDAVEEELEKELANVTAVVRRLEERIASTDEELRRLHAAHQRMESETQHKLRAESLDQQCLALEAVRTATPRDASRTTHLPSPRGAIPVPAPPAKTSVPSPRTGLGFLPQLTPRGSLAPRIPTRVAAH